MLYWHELNTHSSNNHYDEYFFGEHYVLIFNVNNASYVSHFAVLNNGCTFVYIIVFISSLFGAYILWICIYVYIFLFADGTHQQFLPRSAAIYGAKATRYDLEWSSSREKPNSHRINVENTEGR